MPGRGSTHAQPEGGSSGIRKARSEQRCRQTRHSPRSSVSQSPLVLFFACMHTRGRNSRSAEVRLSVAGAQRTRQGALVESELDGFPLEKIIHLRGRERSHLRANRANNFVRVQRSRGPDGRTGASPPLRDQSILRCKVLLSQFVDYQESPQDYLRGAPVMSR